VKQPYETEREAAAAARHIYDLEAGTGAWRDGSLRLMEDACRAAGVQVGAFDYKILVWLAGYEPSTCAVIAGLITRAHAGAPTEAQRGTVLLALKDAAKWRDHLGAADCGDCTHAPTGLCDRHLEDLDAADDYRRVLAELGGAR
jgi:hypothetical protein